MIILKVMRWSNAFSYGKDNVIRFDATPLTQLVGKNGHGKTSIALILEEVLFNKNSKGIKKSDILNRYVKEKAYSIELDFSVDNVDYRISSKRSSTQTVKLERAGEDISAHTATATYKLIEEIIGMDHKAFCQIVFQSSAGSLEFLTATDTNRKKFLIELLNLTKYSRALELFKTIYSDISKDIAVQQSSVDTLTSWIAKYSKTNLQKLTYKDLPEAPVSEKLEIATLETQLLDITKTNKKISQNNTYKELQSKITLMPIPPKPTLDIVGTRNDIAVLNKTVTDAKAFITKMSTLKGVCPTCLSHIDEVKVAGLVEEQQNIVSTSQEKVEELTTLLNKAVLDNTAYKNSIQAQEDWEKYHSLIDLDMPADLLVQQDIEAKLKTLRNSVAAIDKIITEIEKHNLDVSSHNSKVDTISTQLVEFKSDLGVAQEKLKLLTDRSNTLGILVKTFGTTWLVAYKIESLVKDLEDLTNEYLTELSDGRFQISFQIVSNDKLNVIITDTGVDIDILALSGGERARVNACALLAIRKLMQSLSSARINLLILDETVEALDVDGKEKLIEVLLKEESLNTFLVSHAFTHPLLEKLSVVKKAHISKIEV